ncbi:hypothetical protein DPEC_G00068820 [Dallia pectoralis]|uniref:Uncharacterized protein n=1 Tax=Dallia pectoralis TaxID=75939 RepID=A0ACC2H292_DALPE|nr:hypothetical protein DPEC_G00068820 [Dallia pectoralis]
MEQAISSENAERRDQNSLRPSSRLPQEAAAEPATVMIDSLTEIPGTRADRLGGAVLGYLACWDEQFLDTARLKRCHPGRQDNFERLSDWFCCTIHCAELPATRMR